MRLWTPDQNQDAVAEFARTRLAEAQLRVDAWTRREAYAARQRVLWEQRVQGYKTRLGIP